MNNNGVMKHLIRLRKMTNLAIKLEWVVNDPFKNYKIRHEKVEKDFLTKAELGRIENKHFKIERLELVKDLFVFCCYTGLAYVDVMQLTMDNIVEGLDGEDWIKTHRQKNNIPVNTPILPKAKLILKKYLNHPRTTNIDAIFPICSNQKVNSYLKEIADLCGIKKNLTFHIARHTFATLLRSQTGYLLKPLARCLDILKLPLHKSMPGFSKEK
jgi:integrase